MHKLISLLLIAACSSFTFAENRGPAPVRGPQPIRGREDHDRDERRHDERDRRDMVDSTRRLARITLDSLDLNADRLNMEQLRRIQNLLSDISMTMNNAPTLPPPPPYYPPQPLPPPPPVARFVIAGTIESSVFSFNVSNLLELQEQCAAFVQASRLVNVDDISLSVNYGATRVLRNSSSYWTSANKVCNQIIQTVRQDGLGMSPIYGHVVIGTIEALDFKLVASDMASLSAQCTDFVTRNNVSNVDDITLTVDFGSQIVLRNSSSYWRNSFEICQQILQNVR